MLYKNTKVKVYLPDGDTDYFDIVAGVLQGDTLAPYLFIICLDYLLRTSIELIKENDFKLPKARSRRYPGQTIMVADYADDIALLAKVGPLKLVDKFTYLGSSVSSTEKDVNTRLPEEWTKVLGHLEFIPNR